MTSPAIYLKGNAMGKKIRLLIPSALITIFFLALSAYQLSQVILGTATGNDLKAAQISGWTSLVLFLLGIASIILIMRSDSANL
ncbi:hypothetical protein [Dictyobacter kobayashii]|uniref:Uncharacterized protein n=1 Tax=Dictyobacter kobayashii TaxID=2014872 RepID=A0A402AJ45_9CHLR|nr:hypothetical protein [Dictyobacter kobayashii]GCE19188.1 hypothetical protein KDK_29880 [Dictyobacter kobayashii]